MSLVLEVEFLTGVCYAAIGPSSDVPDWPPQPDRVFSALVSAWAARGEQETERPALEWLEQAPPPMIHASAHNARTSPSRFVPPNDFRVPKSVLSKQKWYREFLACGKQPPEKGGHKRNWEQALSTLPEYRRRKERRFPAARPDSPVIALVWQDEPTREVLVSLAAIARDIGYLGHSASLVRCRFLLSKSESQPIPGVQARRRVYPGRLAELEAAYRANPVRPAVAPGSSIFATTHRKATQASADWLVLEVIDRDSPDIRGSAFVSRALRRALMSGYRRAGLGNMIPEIVSGHTVDGAPSRSPHLAIVPLAFAGFPHADGRVFGFALIPPTGTELLDIPGFARALEEVAPYDSGEERRILNLKVAPQVEPFRLAPAASVRPRSLSSEPYLKPARVWASVTPIVLDRHLKGRGDEEVRTIVACACVNAGLPRPDLGRVQVGKHSAIQGAPPARVLTGAPPWTRWMVPESLATRSVFHAVIDFDLEISGPVLLGAGRFTGLGLCRGLGS